jgi:CheY-like chemotaxis protein
MSHASGRPLLLLVEDHADTREMYAEFLGMSFDILEAGDAEQAIAAMGERVPAIVITDFSLPGIDGFELIRRMRGTETTRNVPVICLSGYSGNVHQRDALAVGCDLVMEKPCEPDALARAAQTLAEEGRRPS